MTPEKRLRETFRLRKQAFDKTLSGVCFVISGLDPDELEKFHRTSPPVGWDGKADVVITDLYSLQTAIANADTSSGMYIIEVGKES